MNHDTRTLRRASLTAGIALLLMVVLSPFGFFIALEGLVTPEDAAKTAKDILDSEMLFRWGIASLIVVVVLDIIVAGALLTLFDPVNHQLSTMAAWFRIAYAAVFLVAISQLVFALGLLDKPEEASRAIEVVLIFWLLIKGSRMTGDTTPLAAEHALVS